jgi:hypothetical protein
MTVKVLGEIEAQRAASSKSCAVASSKRRSPQLELDYTGRPLKDNWAARNFRHQAREIGNMRRWMTLLLAWGGISFLKVGAIAAQGPTLPPGPNRDLVSRACQACHDLSMVVAATGLTREGWNATIEEMISYGMRVEPDERTKILDYLSSSLGTPAAPNTPESR